VWAVKSLSSMVSASRADASGSVVVSAALESDVT